MAKEIKCETYRQRCEFLGKDAQVFDMLLSNNRIFVPAPIVKTILVEWEQYKKDGDLISPKWREYARNPTMPTTRCLAMSAPQSCPMSMICRLCVKPSTSGLREGRNGITRRGIIARPSRNSKEYSGDELQGVQALQIAQG